MSLSMDCDLEHTEYHDWLLCIQDQQLREELIKIVGIILAFHLHAYFQEFICLLMVPFTDPNHFPLLLFQGFK